MVLGQLGAESTLEWRVKVVGGKRKTKTKTPVTFKMKEQKDIIVQVPILTLPMACYKNLKIFEPLIFES